MRILLEEINGRKAWRRGSEESRTKQREKS